METPDVTYQWAALLGALTTGAVWRQLERRPRPPDAALRAVCARVAGEVMLVAQAFEAAPPGPETTLDDIRHACDGLARRVVEAVLGDAELN